MAHIKAWLRFYDNNKHRAQELHRAWPLTYKRIAQAHMPIPTLDQVTNASRILNISDQSISPMSAAIVSLLTHSWISVAPARWIPKDASEYSSKSDYVVDVEHNSIDREIVMRQLEKDFENGMWITQTHSEKLDQLQCTPCMEAAKSV